MKRGALALTLAATSFSVAAAGALVVACSSGNIEAGGTLDASSDASSVLGDAGGAVLPGCEDAGVPATTLACTGLYSDFASKQVVATAVPYAPATPLWSDGAEKSRWIQLPPGTTIDVTNPSEWTFPVGTKLWKEFRVDGKRVETRMFQKLTATYWVHATYKWSADDSSALISYGETVPVGTDGGTWTIPNPDNCDQCHRGRSDRILGFEQVGLGLPGATGLTLGQLASQGLLSPTPANVNLTIGDDGTGKNGPAFAWIHVNCGVTCHNTNENASGYGAGMHLRLDPTLLDGGAAKGWDIQTTTIDVTGISGAFQGQTRIIPGDSTDSVIAQVISTRGAGSIQMPPIASNFVDTTDVAAVVAWINALPTDGGIADGGFRDGGGHHDGGNVPDAGDDSGQDAGEGAGLEEAGSSDAAVDATLPDASADDGGAIDATTVDASDAGTIATPDASTPDASTLDASTPDAGADDAAAD